MSQVKAENHLDYLIQAEKLPTLKRGSHTVTAQKITTKQSKITIAQQLHWHGNIDSLWEDQKWLKEPVDEFDRLKEHFMCKHR